MNFLDRAVPLLERGFSIIPLEPKEKKPITAVGGVTRRSRKAEDVAAWGEKYPEANVAVCADETFLILDADDAAEMEKITGKLNTYTVQSSPGKAHYYSRRDLQAFNYIKNLEMGKVGSLRASNQYVVAAGSIHPKTGEPYRVMNDAPVATMDPGVYHKLEIAAEAAEREIERIRANWDGVSKIPSGMRQYFLTSQAGKLHDGVRTEEQILTELMTLNLQFCDPPKPESEISRLAAWVMDKEPNKKGPKVFVGGPKSKRRGFVLEPIRKHDRWFPLCQLSLIYGASGAGKSHLALQMLEQVAQGGEFLGHKASCRSILVVIADRDREEYEDLLDKIGIPVNLFDVRDLDPELLVQGAVVQATAVNRLIEDAGRPEVVLLEGLDVLTTDHSSRGVTPLLKNFQRVASCNGSALIATWGSPKRQSTKDAYKGLRDAAAGSSMVGRLCATMVYVREDNEGGRHVDCGHRLTAPERFVMRFKEDGRLHLYAEVDIPDAPADPLDRLIREHAWAEIKDFVNISQATYYRRRGELGIS